MSQIVKGAELAPVVISGGGKGGVAKSQSAQAAIATLVAGGYETPLIVEFEADARQVRFYGDATASGDGPAGAAIHVPIRRDDLLAIEETPSIVYKAFDVACRHISEARREGRPVVLDLAANMDFGLASYLNVMAGSTILGDGQNVLILGSANGKIDSMEAAVKAIGYLKQGLPKARAVALLHNIEPNAARLPTDPSYKQFERLVREQGAVEVVYIQRILAPDLLRYADDKGMPLHALAAREVEELAAESGQDESDITRGLARLIRYLKLWSDLLGRYIPMRAM